MTNLLQKLMLGSSAVAMTTALVASAQAQQTQPSIAVEEIIVSGSRINLGGFEAPTPVTIVDAAKLQSNAYANITDSVRQLPQVNSPPASFGASQGSGSPGTAGANLLNLRSMGVNRTLVLFDGQRTVESNLTGGVDITTLPSAVISRVDVVTGGASAAWGSDAVAGVVNFVIDKNYVGLKGSMQGGTTTSGLVRSVSSELMWGANFLGERGHIEVAGSYNNRPDTVLLMEQKWYRGAYLVNNPGYGTGVNQPKFIIANHVGLSNSSMGGIIIASPIGTGATPAAANALKGIQFLGNGIVDRPNFGTVTGSALSSGGSITDRTGEAPWQTIGGPNKTYSIFSHASYKLTDTIQASIQMNYGYFTGKGDAQSYQQLGLVIKADNAFIPTDVKNIMTAGGIPSFTMGTINGNNFNNYTVTHDNYTSQAEKSLAPATTINRRKIMRGVFTLEGTLGDDWSWNTYYSESKTRFSVEVKGIPVIANLTAAQDAVFVTATNVGTSGLAVGSIVCRQSLPGQSAVVVGKVTAASGCVPLNVFGEGVASAGAISYVTGNNQDFEKMSINLDVAEASMQGKLPWALPAGDITVAFGVNWRRQGGGNVATTTGDFGGYSVGNYSNFPKSSMTVTEQFLEINVPILKNMFVESLDFNTAARLTDYSTSGKVQTWKTGLTSQLNDDVKLRSVLSVDIRAPTLQDLFAPANVNTVSCKDPKTNITQSCISNVLGNPTLSPEVARTFSAGVVLSPSFIPGLNLSVDYFHLHMTGQIASVSTNLILSTCTLNINDKMCSMLAFNGLNGALSAFNRTPINLSSFKTSGFDIQASYPTQLWGGSLVFSANANYTDEITVASPGAAVNNYAGVLGAGGAPQASGSPKWKGLLSASYKTGPYSFTVQSRFLGAAILNNTWNDGNLSTGALVVADNVMHVDPTAYFDLRGSYQWTSEIQLYAAIDNVFNIPPQMVPGYSGSIQSNGGPLHSVTQYDMLGRDVRAGIRFKF